MQTRWCNQHMHNNVDGEYLVCKCCDMLCPSNQHSKTSSKIYNMDPYVTVSAKTVLNGTCIITRKTDLKYSRCCGSVVLDFSHARFTV